MTPPLKPLAEAGRPTTPGRPHRLRIDEIDLVGGGRNVPFKPGFNIVVGEITTGKTTLVRLIRGLLGTFPSSLPPEVQHVSAIRGEVVLGEETWLIYRPRTTTSSAVVEVSERYPASNREPLSLRLPATASRGSYSHFLLDRLAIPDVSVPQARSDPGGILTPVSMTDWLGYCIVTGDELDTQVFGHQHTWRDAKRRWVFELAYGYYDPELAILNSQLRNVVLQINDLAHDLTVHEKFLAGTPFADLDALERQIATGKEQLAGVRALRNALARDAGSIPGVGEIRESLLAAREQRAVLEEGMIRLRGQIKDLKDLERQLRTQSSRLTRAIVADEWLVDFDFVVCPRCGSSVDAGRSDPHLCYLCLQPPAPATSTEQLIGEQTRITSQIQETSEVIDLRTESLEAAEADAARLDERIRLISAELSQQTEAFISDRAAQIEHFAFEEARLQSEAQRLGEYRELLTRHRKQALRREVLEEKREEITSQIQSHEFGKSDAEANVRALEDRMLRYLRELHIPEIGSDLSVKINRNTYLPEISGRTFDELSSQGLKTLVNVAHSLAHHTVAIDRNLPIPGLLILDGLSSNAGHEGFDRDRVRDVYVLLRDVALEYAGALQVIAVDNPFTTDLLLEIQEYLALTLTQEDRLIRTAQG
jgi:hypothetical protein